MALPVSPSPEALLARLTDTAPVPPPLLRVCAWHESPATLVALSQQHPAGVTHGICDRCAALMLEATR